MESMFIHEAFTPIQNYVHRIHRENKAQKWKRRGRREWQQCEKIASEKKKKKTKTKFKTKRSKFTENNFCSTYLYVCVCARDAMPMHRAYNIWYHIYIYCSAYIRNETIKTPNLNFCCSVVIRSLARCAFSFRSHTKRTRMQPCQEAAMATEPEKKIKMKKKKILTTCKDWRDTHTFFYWK